MWNGRWSRELDSLYEMYYDLFETEPDCDLEETEDIDYDRISYREFRDRIMRSITRRQRIK